MEKNRYNYVLDFFRFIFSIIVIVLHSSSFGAEVEFQPFVGGYIAVEFFFIVSGFFLMKKINEVKIDKLELGRYSINYGFSKYKRCFGYLFIALVFIYTLNIINNNIELIDVGNFIFELFLLPMIGFDQKFLLTTSWFLGALIIWETILLYIGLKNKDFFQNLFMYFVCIVGYGFIFKTYGHLEVWRETLLGWFLVGNVRAMAGICAGCICYNLSQKINKINFSLVGKIFLSFVEYIGIIFVIYRTFYYTHTYYDFIYVIIFIICIAIMNSEKSITNSINSINLNICKFLGKISLPVYILHYPILLQMLNYVKGWNYLKILAIYIPITILFSLIVYFILKCLNKVKFCKILIKNK